MNDTIETVMSFINENTTILILICVFLIVVLMAYLIDNSIKSRKIKKSINKEKEEIKKKREQDKIDLEQEKINKQFENAIIEEKTLEDEIISTPVTEDITEDKIVPTTIIKEESIEQNNNDTIFDSKVNETPEEEIISIDNILPIKEEIKQSEEEVEVIYKNDKKLSEILFDNIEKQPEGKLDESIVKTNESEKSENNDKMSDSATELDAIMRKLNNMDNNVEDDKYTNIF